MGRKIFAGKEKLVEYFCDKGGVLESKFLLRF